jgi:hypothetical protein
VEDKVVMVNVLWNGGMLDAGLKAHAAPEGRGVVQERLIGCDV